MSTTPYAFICYRRADSSAASRWLATNIARTFGAASVFIDTEAIRMSENWADRIDEALRTSTLFLPIIGPKWLSLLDSDYRRRIDHPDDWVHKEILHALTERKRVLPILLSRTAMPAANALPQSLSRLTQFQNVELRDERWESDLALMFVEMRKFGFKRISSSMNIRYPRPRVTLSELSPQELRDGISGLRGWKIVTSEDVNRRPYHRTELIKVYEFANFMDAIGFMSEAAPQIEKWQHHPRWENTWRSVSVRLSTWDIGHKVSRLDLDLAEYLDLLKKKFPISKTGI